MAERDEPQGVMMSPEQKRQRERRNLAIAASLVGLVVLFWVITIFKMGGNVLQRPI